MKTTIPPSAQVGARSRRARAFSTPERLESRIAPAYVATLAGAAGTLTGDAADDTLVISMMGGLLAHNRFAAGDAGFASALDFDSGTPGTQTLAADGTGSLAIDLGTGLDTVVLGGNGRAGLLATAIAVTNTGANGDVLEVSDEGNTTGVALTLSAASIVGGPFNITRAGDVFGKLIVRTGSGADTIAHSGTLATLTVVQTGAGNDSVTGNATSALEIDGGAGADLLQGSNLADVIRGGAGPDTIVGRQGADTLFGDDGLDVFTWNPGDGSDAIDGGTGVDVMEFNGANVAENITLDAVNGHFRLFRNVASIVMDAVALEQVELETLGGADVVTVSDLSSTTVRAVRIGFAGAGGIGDGQVDLLTVLGTDLDDRLRVDAIASGVKVTGVGAGIEMLNFEPTDTLTVSGAAGVDNVFATPAALAKLPITLVGETAHNLPAPLNYAAPVSYGAGKTPTALAAGNLFGTSGVVSTDLVVVDAKLNALFILPNAGNGTYLPAVQLGTGGKAPRGVVLEDFNADGRLDIAVTNSGSANVAVLLNAGDGTFGAPTLFPTTKTPGVVRAGDVNGDTFADLVMTSAGNTVTILPGNGDGTFDAPVKLLTGGKVPADVVLGDFSGDGRLDLAVANGGSGTVSLLRANPDFSFAKPELTRVGVKPSALAVGDFDGDTRPDLAVTHAVSRWVSVLLNGSPTTVAFSSQIKIARPGNNGPLAVAAGDLNGDGRADLVIGNSAAGTLSVLFNAGGAIFRPAVTHDLDNTPPRKISAVALADLDGDGLLDIAAANAGTADVSVISRLAV